MSNLPARRKNLLDTTWEPPMRGTIRKVTSQSQLQVTLDVSGLTLACDALVPPTPYAVGQVVVVVFFLGGVKPMVIGHG